MRFILHFLHCLQVEYVNLVLNFTGTIKSINICYSYQVINGFILTTNAMPCRLISPPLMSDSMNERVDLIYKTL